MKTETSPTQPDPAAPSFAPTPSGAATAVPAGATAAPTTGATGATGATAPTAAPTRRPVLLVALAAAAGLVMLLGAALTAEPVTAQACPPYCATPIITPAWHIHMCDEPYQEQLDDNHCMNGPGITEFPAGTEEVWIIYCHKYSDTVVVHVKDQGGGVAYINHPDGITYQGEGCESLRYYQAGGIAPAGSPYRTSAYWPEGPFSGVSPGVEWYIGLFIAFDAENYYGNDAQADVTARDPGANTAGFVTDEIQARLTSDSDPEGFMVTLREEAPSFPVFRLVTPISFSQIASDPANNVLKVKNRDTIRISYCPRNCTTPYEDTATWYQLDATITPTPLPTWPGPPPTSTPTPPPQLQVEYITLRPNPLDVGYAPEITNKDRPNHLGYPDLFVGMWTSGRNAHYGMIRFDLSPVPEGSEILDARLKLMGRNQRFLDPGTWAVKILDPSADMPWRDLTFEQVRTATSLAPFADALSDVQLGEGRMNSLGLDPVFNGLIEDRLDSTGYLSLRLDGPGGQDNNLFAWETGVDVYGRASEPPDPDLGPSLDLTYIRTGDSTGPTPPPSATASPGPSPTPGSGPQTPTSTQTASATPGPGTPSATLAPADATATALVASGSATPGPSATATLGPGTPSPTLGPGTPSPTFGPGTPTATLGPGTPSATPASNTPGAGQTGTPPTGTPASPTATLSSAQHTATAVATAMGTGPAVTSTWTPGGPSPGPGTPGADTPTPGDTPGGSTPGPGTASATPGDGTDPPPNWTAGPSPLPTDTATPEGPLTGRQVCILVYVDANASARREYPERLLPGATIRLTHQLSGAFLSWTTDGANEPDHCWAGLTDGAYELELMELPRGYEPSGLEVRTFHVPTTLESVLYEFGAHEGPLPSPPPPDTATPAPTAIPTERPTSTPQPTVTGPSGELCLAVYHDRDSDGFRAEHEAYLRDVRMTILTETGQISRELLSDTGPVCSRLPVGVYTARAFVAPAHEPTTLQEQAVLVTLGDRVAIEFGQRRSVRATRLLLPLVFTELGPQ